MGVGSGIYISFVMEFDREFKGELGVGVGTRSGSGGGRFYCIY